MRKVVFPPATSANPDGVVAVGGDMQVDTLIAAYSAGIFPWPLSPEYPLAWFSPDPRGILYFNELHVPSSLKKFSKKSPFHIKHDCAFREIIQLCAAVPRKGQASSWITPALIEGYCQLYEAGHAWCSGAWLDQRLVGGVYGVKLKGFRSGESMFTLEDNAGKCALLAAIERWRKEGVGWMDTQMVTPVVASFGGREMSREDFLVQLQIVLAL